MSDASETRIFQTLPYFPTEGYSFATPDHFYRVHFTTMPQNHVG